MSEPDEQANYATCNCQNCGGHIKFDASQFRKGETRTVECPHCHLDTVLFIRDGQPGHSEKAKENLLGQPHNLYGHGGAATRFELFVLRLTRSLTLIGAALVIAAFAVTALVFLWTLLPNPKPSPKITAISYKEISSVIESQATHPPTTSYGTRINTAEAVPPIVANFAVHHPEFQLDTAWMNQDLRKVFLENLAVILQTAKANHLSDTQLVQMVQVYVSLWTTENTPKPEPKPLFSKADIRSFCMTSAASLFIVITVLCLILVLLAIERNIRLIAERPTSSNTTPGTS